MNTPNNDPQRVRSQARIIILVVVTMFVAPIMLAWWFARHGPPAGLHHLTNHGTLIRPPVDIRKTPATHPLEALHLAASEWALIYYGPGACSDVCAATLTKLAVIRSVLGHAGSRVHVVALLDAPSKVPEASTTLVSPEARTFLTDTLLKRDVSKTDAGIVFLDWRGQIMMYFPTYAQPGHIKDDLSRLLRASSIE